jgi:hypothetical protein
MSKVDTDAARPSWIGMPLARAQAGGSMKLITTLGLAAVCAVGLNAQSGTSTTKTKVEVKDGKEITVGGCLERNPAGGYMLTTTNGSMKYALVTDDDLSKHLGHRVEVKGKAADRGDGKVKIESKVGTGGDKSTAKTEAKGDDGMHYLGMKSLKMISASCM